MTVAAVDDKTLSFKQQSLVKTTEFSCQIGVPFEETTADGRKVSWNELEYYRRRMSKKSLKLFCHYVISNIILKFQVNSLMSAVAPNALKHDMKGTDGGKDSVCVRTFFEDKMTCVCNVDDIETTRVYVKQP